MTWVRSRPPEGDEPACLRGEARFVAPPEARGPTPFRLGPEDFDPPPKERAVQDERLELPAFAARMDASGFLEPEQVRNHGLIPPAPKPARIEAFRGDARERDVKPRGHVFAHELSRIVPP